MKCAFCNGTGVVQNYFKQDIVCPDCLGTGVISITNADKIRNMSDEELAKFLVKTVGFADEKYSLTMFEAMAKAITTDIKLYPFLTDAVTDWLQQECE